MYSLNNLVLRMEKGVVPMENSLRQKRPAEQELPKVLEEMSAEKREAGFRAFMEIAMRLGAAKISANPGLLKRQ